MSGSKCLGGPGCQRSVIHPWRVGAELATTAATGLGLAGLRWTGWGPSWEGLRLHLGRAPQPRASGSQLRRLRLPADPAWKIPAPVAWLYTPPGFEAVGSPRYPVAYLLHGSPGHAADWFASGAADTLDRLICLGVLPPVVALAPDLNAWGTWESSGLDVPGGSQVETFFSFVRRWAAEFLPLSSDRAATAFIGMSMGAYCALDQGIRHADEVGWIAALAPYGDPGSGFGRRHLTPEQFQRYSPSAYIATTPRLAEYPLSFYLSYDEAEHNRTVGRTARALAAALRARDQAVILEEEPGLSHTWWFAQKALTAALGYWGTELGTEQSAANALR